MTDTTIADAVVFPQDDGTGVPDGSELYTSAGIFSCLARYKGSGSYVGEDNTGAATLQFNDVDTTNEEVDVGVGHAFILDSNIAIQSDAGTTYDTVLPDDVPFVVALPSEVTNLALDTDTTNDLWLAFDPTTSTDPVYIRHGSGLSAPSDPNVKLGTVDTASGATTRANDYSDATAGFTVFKDNIELDTGRIDVTGSQFSDTNDSMTANPETDAESGYIEVDVNGTTKQVPFYDP